jgi:glutathione S-transferase
VNRTVLVGRSSSHFTRAARIFAHELGVPFELSPVYDIASVGTDVFAGNPTLRVPSLRTESGLWFGTLNVCRELARRATQPCSIVWPEALTDATAANAQEIVLETMAAEVTVVMARVAKVTPEHPFLAKPVARIDASVQWLERERPAVLARFPERSLSFLEVTAFCLCTHLGFREVRSIDDCPNLVELSRAFGARPSARASEYRFDQPPGPDC